jgi:hypothetical protein
MTRPDANCKARAPCHEPGVDDRGRLGRQDEGAMADGPGKPGREHACHQFVSSKTPGCRRASDAEPARIQHEDPAVDSFKVAPEDVEGKPVAGRDQDGGSVVRSAQCVQAGRHA